MVPVNCLHKQFRVLLLCTLFSGTLLNRQAGSGKGQVMCSGQALLTLHTCGRMCHSRCGYVCVCKHHSKQAMDTEYTYNTSAVGMSRRHLVLQYITSMLIALSLIMKTTGTTSSYSEIT